MRCKQAFIPALFVLAAFASLSGCKVPVIPGMGGGLESPDEARVSLFIGVDVSGSFLKSRYFEDAMDFLSHYIYYHMHGLGGLDRPRAMFVGSLGGNKKGEAKTFYPIQTFEGKSAAEIKAKLNQIFPRSHEDPYTDFNSFFEHVEDTVKNKGLILRPINILLMSDGIPDFPNEAHVHDLKKIQVRPLELLSRNITVRLLYTNAVIGSGWLKNVKRQRVKVWTQDALVMTQWKDPKILKPGVAPKDQDKFISWLKDNVDFPARLKRVD